LIKEFLNEMKKMGTFLLVVLLLPAIAVSQVKLKMMDFMVHKDAVKGFIDVK
jgi:hypothetical protein